MKFKYIGDRDETSTLGYVFEKGKAVEVNELAASKLINNPDYKRVVPRPKVKAVKDGD